MIHPLAILIYRHNNRLKATKEVFSNRSELVPRFIKVIMCRRARLFQETEVNIKITPNLFPVCKGNLE